VITIIQRIAKQFAMIDTFFIDRLFVQGSTQLIQWMAKRLQPLQSGWLYNYLLIMIASLTLFLIGVVLRD
jgi:NADH:ubiquinone oxidoreductase subunit 5 (subunit L)/multisubunit Na+/H+ antiporter MnhA subunit